MNPLMNSGFSCQPERFLISRSSGFTRQVRSCKGKVTPKHRKAPNRDPTHHQATLAATGVHRHCTAPRRPHSHPVRYPLDSFVLPQARPTRPHPERVSSDFRARKQALESDPLWTALNRDERSEVERRSFPDRRIPRPSRSLPHARGLAIFACEALKLFEAVPLFRVHRSRLILDDTPWIAELAAAERESEPIVAVVIDRGHARFFEGDCLWGERAFMPRRAEHTGRQVSFGPRRLARMG